MAMAVALSAPIFRTESFGLDPSWCGSKRQVFLRSYQFSRKLSLSERIKGSLVKVKRILWLRLRRSSRRLRRFVWAKMSNLRRGFSARRRPSRFVRLVGVNQYYRSSKCDGFPCFF